MKANSTSTSKKGASSADQSWTAYIIINYRWVLVCFFLLPISLVYDLVYLARSWFIFKLNSAPKKHDQRVKYVQKQVEIETIRFVALLFILENWFSRWTNGGNRVVKPPCAPLVRDGRPCLSAKENTRKPCSKSRSTWSTFSKSIPKKK